MSSFVDDYFDALFVDRAHAVARNTQAHPALFGFEPETLRVQVWQEAATALVVGVRNAISGHRLLAGDLTDSGHGDSSDGRPRMCRAGRKNESRFIPAG